STPRPPRLFFLSLRASDTQPARSYRKAAPSLENRVCRVCRVCSCVFRVGTMRVGSPYIEGTQHTGEIPRSDHRTPRGADVKPRQGQVRRQPEMTTPPPADLGGIAAAIDRLADRLDRGPRDRDRGHRRDFDDDHGDALEAGTLALERENRRLRAELEAAEQQRQEARSRYAHLCRRLDALAAGKK